jgi:hypothetical protein
MHRLKLQRWTTTVIGAGAVLSLLVGAAVPAAATPSARQLLNTAWRNAETAKSVTMSGGGTDSGQTFALHISANAKGDAQGWIAVQGDRMYIVKVGPEGYFKAGAKFWQDQGGTGGTAAATLFADKWLKAHGSSSPLAGFSRYLGIRGFFSQNPPSQISNVTVKQTQFHGHPAYAVRGSQGGKKGTVIISASSPNYPLAITSPGNGTLTFTNWNGHVTVHAPHGAIDFNKLAGS